MAMQRAFRQTASGKRVVCQEVHGEGMGVDDFDGAPTWRSVLSSAALEWNPTFLITCPSWPTRQAGLGMAIPVTGGFNLPGASLVRPSPLRVRGEG